MTLKYYIQSLDLPDLKLKAEYFDRKSSVHGIAHTARVMVHVLAIGWKLDNSVEAKLAYNAAFIHDMARSHDRECSIHGAVAARTKMHLLDIAIQDKADVFEAVTDHCTGRSNSLVTDILCDADALDIIRLRPIDRRRLRLPVTAALIPFAEELVEFTNYKTALNYAICFHK